MAKILKSCLAWVEVVTTAEEQAYALATDHPTLYNSETGKVRVWDNGGYIDGPNGPSTTVGYVINVQALTSSPTDGQTVYFGMLPKVPVTTGGMSRIYIRKSGTIKIAEIYCYSGTAGTAEAWSLYIRKNNTTDTLIATLSVNTNERAFTKSDLNIAVVAGDYIEIKSVNPTWATNPLTCIFGGYIYIE